MSEATGRWRWATPASWVVFAVCAVVVLGSTLTHDFRDESIAGDTGGHLMQALSLAYDSHSLNFDARDLERWKELGWAQEPVGMFFQRYDGDRWGVAKPYGYSLYLAPFIAVLGPVHGIALGNTLLLAAMMLITILLLRTRYDGPVVPLLTGAFYLASYVYMYAFWVHSELFLGLLTLIAFAGAVRFAQTEKAWWAVLSFAAIGFAGSEKGAYLALYAPIGIVMLWKARTWRLRIALPLVSLVVLAVAVLPYLRYSDWESFNPYGGDRYVVQNATPFAGGTTGFKATNYSGEDITLFIDSPVAGKLEAFGYTIAGRHTGMLVYLPVALLLLIAALAHVRKADAWGRAALLSVLGYIVFYAFFFPTNFFGGGQSLGNRYFLQAAPAIIAMVVLMRLPRATVLWCSLIGIVLGVVLLLPQHERPQTAHVHIERTSAPQRLLPFEANQLTRHYFECVKLNLGDVTACP
ncbi:MAG: hypothetical protein ABW060_08650 [Solirubrobacteraceae bacterium]